MNMTEIVKIPRRPYILDKEFIYYRHPVSGEAYPAAAFEVLETLDNGYLVATPGVIAVVDMAELRYIQKEKVEVKS
jgi:hypothetical protein